jgi:hypothetical protein
LYLQERDTAVFGRHRPTFQKKLLPLSTAEKGENVEVAETMVSIYQATWHHHENLILHTKG